MIDFSISDIRSIADPSTFDRGYDANEASFSEVQNTVMISDDIMQIRSVTQGSKLYKQTINVYSQDEDIKIIGKCSCSVAKNCKHVISSALAFLDQEPVEVKKPLQAKTLDTKELWLKRLEASFDQESEEVFSTSTVLLYEFHLSKDAQEIELSLYTARQLKNGGYGKVNRARPNTLFNSYKPPEYLREIDKEALTLFKALSTAFKTTTAVKGRIGALLIETALKTGRCFWQKGHTKPLCMAEIREANLYWKEEAEYAELAFSLGQESFFLPTEPPYYIDTKKKVLGHIQSELTMQQLEILSNAPKVEYDDLEEFALEIASKLPSLHLQAPESIDLKTVSNVKIIPCLRLGNANDGYLLEMGFKYAGHYIDAFPALDSCILAEKRLKIERDIQEEGLYIERIKAFGFILHANRLKAEGLHAWKSLLNAEEELISDGYEIRRDKSFKLNFQSIRKVNVNVEQTSHWFDVGMHITLDNRELPLLPIISKFLNEGMDLQSQDSFDIEFEEGSYITLSSTILEPILNTFYELLHKPNSEGFKLQRYEAHAMNNFSHTDFSIQDKTSLSDISHEMKAMQAQKVKPKGVEATLRGYQQEGVAWMQFLRKYNFGGILADDMGLGKTIQTLAHLQIEKEEGRLNAPALIVAPTSLLGNWVAEANKFTPNLRIVQYYGDKRNNILDNINDYDLIVTTYTLLTLEIEKLQNQKFYYLILDEAQKIKNARSESTKSTRLIQAEHSLALSGTPMENHLGELHSIFETVMPGFLGSLKDFKSMYQNPIEKACDMKSQERLNKRIAPFMLRRTKEKVAKELPEKTEMIRSVSFESDQARLYETIRVSMEKSVRESIKQMGIAKSHISILAALLKLRQVCCDPRLLKIEEAQKIQNSAKLEMLMDLVGELREEGRRILIFSQFTAMLEIIEEQMISAKIPYSKLTGETRKRQEQIDGFNDGKSEVFLISLKAGGVGLNLTSADTVIHYDPWWNPAAQDQATDRAYRIGQDKPVFVYKLVVQNSVEEKIVKMQEDKRDLANAIYEEKEQGFSAMDEKDLLELFK